MDKQVTLTIEDCKVLTRALDCITGEGYLTNSNETKKHLMELYKKLDVSENKAKAAIQWL